MPGFFVSNINNDFVLKNVFPDRCIEEVIPNNAFSVKRNTLNKFLDDKIFFEDADRIIITEGVILNKLALMAKYNQNDFVSTIVHISKLDESMFYNEFRGSFSGAIYYKSKDRWVIYTNHYGDKAIFYYSTDTKFIIGSQVNYVLDALKESDINITLNKKAVYFIMTYAFMADDSTYVNEIKRLLPGHYIQIENGKLSVLSYWKLQKNKYDLAGLANEEIIQRLDEKFRAAVKMEYDKDIEYNYQHIADLSGGLDSRMNVWVAHDMGYRDMLNISYSQSGYTDEIVAKEVSKYLHTDLIFKQLDDAKFVYDVDSIISMNYGTALYCGITGGKRLLDCINFNAFGLEHTGQLGDVVIGSYLKNPNDIAKKSLSGLYSSRLASKTDLEHLNVYDDHELYKMNVRGFLGILSTHFIRQNYTEVASPFLDVNFMEFCFSIPIEKRLSHYIYKKWILNKYPHAATFKWQSTNSKLTAGTLEKVLRNLPCYIYKIANKIFPDFISNKFSMNPFDYWYKKNQSGIRAFIIKYYEDTCEVVSDNQITKDMLELFDYGSSTEKCQVLTALSSLKYFFRM